MTPKNLNFLPIHAPWRNISLFNILLTMHGDKGCLSYSRQVSYNHSCLNFKLLWILAFSRAWHIFIAKARFFKATSFHTHDIYPSPKYIQVHLLTLTGCCREVVATTLLSIKYCVKSKGIFGPRT